MNARTISHRQQSALQGSLHGSLHW